jgi:RNA polymerase sigma-70 factor (ECF subfamily)
MDDDELVTAIAAGDETALRELFCRHAPWLAARLRQALPAADTEDVLQETFVAVWQGAKRYRPAGVAGAWLWGIARRQAALYLRRRGPVTLELLELPERLTGGGQAGDPAEAVLSGVAIAAAARTLGPDGSPEREVWRLVYVEDRPVAEAAEVLGVPVGTVKSRAHRVRRRLRAALRTGAAGEGGAS